jgi:hypothetical protein
MFVVQEGRGTLFLLWENIFYGFPFVVVYERLFYILIHFSLTNICFRTFPIPASPIFEQVIG